MTTWVSPISTGFGADGGTNRARAPYWPTIKDMRDAMVACGFVQTADTGQIDLTLTDNDTTNNTNPPEFGFYSGGYKQSGFFIVRFDDALQTTKPVFIRLGRFFQRDAYQYVGGMVIQVGTGTDGAGNITGYKTDAAWLTFNNGTDTNGIATTNRRNTYASGNGSEFVMSVHEAANTPNEGFMITIERTRDEVGAYDGEGVLIQWMPSSTSNMGTAGPAAAHLAFPTNGRTDPLLTGWQGGLITPRTTPYKGTLQSGNNIGPLPPFGGAFFPKFRHTHVIYQFPWVDQPNFGNIITMPVFGVNRTFRNVGYQYSHWTVPPRSFPQSATAGAQAETSSLFMMWE